MVLRKLGTQAALDPDVLYVSSVAAVMNGYVDESRMRRGPNDSKGPSQIMA